MVHTHGLRILTCVGILLLSAGVVIGREHMNGDKAGDRYDDQYQDRTQQQRMEDTNGVRDMKDARDTNGVQDTNGVRPKDGRYDENGLQTYSGTVQKVDTTGEVNILSLQTEQGLMDVYTAPGWYFQDENISLGEGDSVQVKGRQRSFNGEIALEATELRIFSNAVQLRKQDGSPQWEQKKSGPFNRRRRRR